MQNNCIFWNLKSSIYQNMPEKEHNFRRMPIITVLLEWNCVLQIFHFPCPCFYSWNCVFVVSLKQVTKTASILPYQTIKCRMINIVVNFKTGEYWKLCMKKYFTLAKFNFRAAVDLRNSCVIFLCLTRCCNFFHNFVNAITSMTSKMISEYW